MPLITPHTIPDRHELDVPEHIMLILSQLPTETQKVLLDLASVETGWGSFQWNHAPKELTPAEWRVFREWARDHRARINA